jgi:D-glycero-D-manno-heptose 1,7-bisphosphate phosphatase
MPLGTKKVVFLDLDGVVYKLVDHFDEYGVSARTEDEIAIVEGLEERFKKLVEKGWLIVGITNQPDIARGKTTPEFLAKKHELLQKKYPQISEIFPCIHTETDLCKCRKPKPGLLKTSGKKFGADFALSWMVGDSRSDVEAGHAVRARTILIQTVWNSESTVPVLGYVTAVCKDIAGALDLILNVEEGASNKHDA